MFNTKYIGKTLFVEGDLMKGKVEPLQPKVFELAEDLGLPGDAWGICKHNSVDWVKVFEDFGARQVCYRDWLQSQPETKKWPVPSIGVQVVLVAKDSEGRYHVLVQRRPSGLIGFPGGESVIWCYDGRNVWEDMRLTADRTFREETGKEFDDYLVYLHFVNTTNHHSEITGSPDVYVFNMYFGAEISFRKIQTYVNTSKREGKIMVVPVDELVQYQWYINATPVFNLLQSIYL